MELSAMPVQTKARWIVDCDPGVDDAAAIITAVRSRVLDLAGITTVYVNAELEFTTRNALLLVQLLDAGLPVYRGADRALAAPPRRALGVHGLDGFGELDMLPLTVRDEQGHAADFILDQACRNPGRVNVLALGPLTNLALALARDPSLQTRLRRIVWMGGTHDLSAGTSREFNLDADPEAAALVLSSGVPMTIVPWETASSCLLTGELLDRLAQATCPVSRTFWRAGRVMARFIKRHLGREGLLLCDLAAAAVAIAPGTILRETGILLGSGGASRVRMVLEVDVKAVLHLFLDAMVPGPD